MGGEKGTSRDQSVVEIVANRGQMAGAPSAVVHGAPRNAILCFYFTGENKLNEGQRSGRPGAAGVCGWNWSGHGAGLDVAVVIGGAFLPSHSCRLPVGKV